MKTESRWTIDSIEESVAHIEVDGHDIMHVPQRILPGDAREGDVLSVRQELTPERSVLEIQRDQFVTQQAMRASTRQMKGAPKAGKGNSKP